MDKPPKSVATALGRAHTKLLADLRKLEAAVRPARREGIVELRRRLGTTQKHLTEHFRFEEGNGYLDVVQKREPRLDRAIQQLAEEHVQLAQSLEKLIAEAQAAPDLTDVLAGQVRDWIQRVRQHEVRENDLVQDAFELDIGAED